MYECLVGWVPLIYMEVCLIGSRVDVSGDVSRDQYERASIISL